MAKRKKRPKATFYRINHYIQAQEVRVVDEKGKQVGLMPLPKALQQAHQKQLDLVEVAPRAKPPVCKIIDFKKFKFLESKKKKEEKKKLKKVELKEIRLTPFIAENDLNFRLERAIGFLKEGDRVKVAVVFKGRQMTKKDFGYKLIEKALEKIRPFSKIEVEPRFVGRRLEMTLAPLKGGQNEPTKDENKKVSQKKTESH